jgi:hypothetical protein
MDQNRDWKPIAALVLAGLALFVALGGSRNDREIGVAPQPIIVQPAAPSTGGVTPPVITMPAPAAPQMPYGAHHWGGGGGFALIPLLFLVLIGVLVFRVIGRGRHGWGRPGWHGGPSGGPGQPQQPPFQGQYPPQQPQGQGQYPPQQAQGQYPPQQAPFQGQYPQYPRGQAYGGYPQGEQPQQPQQPQPGQQTQAMDAQDDITRPEGSGEY